MSKHYLGALSRSPSLSLNLFTLLARYNESFFFQKLALKVKGKGAIHARQCDISKIDEIESTFKWIEEKFKGIDILVNNAGILKDGSITGIPFELNYLL